MIILHFILICCLRPALAINSLSTISTSTILPTILSLESNINDFSRFADGGDDANWYIGYNNAWLVRLPPAPLGEFSKAYIGAKIGRAKSRPNSEKPWLREGIPGKIYMSISQTPAFSAQQSFFLAETPDLPQEADPQAHVDHVGASEWFWAEVPSSLVSFSTDNYLIIWSPTNAFVASSSAPVLAAAGVETVGETSAWNNRSISGAPPRNAEGSLETPLKNLHPALAIKLVPPASSEISVSEFLFERAGRACVIRFSAWGENISDAWVESSRDGLDWARVSRFERRQPLVFTLPAGQCTPGSYLRGAVSDILGTVGQSEPFQIPVAP